MSDSCCLPGAAAFARYHALHGRRSPLFHAIVPLPASSPLTACLALHARARQFAQPTALALFAAIRAREKERDDAPRLCQRSALFSARATQEHMPTDSTQRERQRMIAMPAADSRSAEMSTFEENQIADTLQRRRHLMIFAIVRGAICWRAARAVSPRRPRHPAAAFAQPPPAACH